MSQNRSEDFKELIDFKIQAEAREKELIEVVSELKTAFLELCVKYGEESNAFAPYIKSLKY